MARGTFRLRSLVAHLASGIFCICGLAGPAWGQAGPDSSATRAGEAAAARQASAASARPDAPGKAEALFNYLERSRIATRLFDPPEGWLVLMGGMSEGNGLSGGAGYRLRAGRSTTDLQVIGSIRESYLLRADWTQPIEASERTFVSARVAYSHEAQLRFSGLGAGSDAGDRVGYALDSTRVEGAVGVRFSPSMVATAGAGLLASSIGGPADQRLLPIGRRFSEATAPGLTDQPTYVVFQSGLQVDTRDAPNARRGGLYQLDVRRFVDRDHGAHGFTSTRLELQQFVPFWNESRVLALRALAEHNAADQGAVVPFYLRPTLGGSRSLRGFDRQRFRDASALLLQAEYRYEVNAFLMAALFVDAGQVAPSLGDVRWRDLETDYGIGLRFGYATGVALRTDVAFGGERGPRVILTFSAPF